jgi:predicted nuclease of predicted toxin-antitoxin system
VRVKVDEDLPLAVARALRRAGHEAHTVIEQELGGAPDAVVWQAAQQENRLLVTADKGFADIREHPPGTHRGVVLLRPREDGIRPVMRLLEALLRDHALEQLSGCVTVVSPNGIRVRRE